MTARATRTSAARRAAGLAGLLCLLAASVGAAAAETAWLEVTLEPTTVTVGDRIGAVIELHRPPGHKLAGTPRFPVWGERWGDVEILEVGPVVAVPREGGEVLAQRLVLTSFRPGTAELPPRTVAVPGPETTARLATPAGLAVTVRSVLPPSEAAEGSPGTPEPPAPQPPAPPRELPVPTAFWWTLAALGLPIALGLLALARRRPPPGAARAAASPLDQLAAALAAARREPSSGRGHTLVSHALRRYLARRLDLPALESTTTEIRRALAAHDLPRPLQAELGALLAACDRVKFAAVRSERSALEERAAAAERLAAEIEQGLAAPATPSHGPAGRRP